MTNFKMVQAFHRAFNYPANIEEPSHKTLLMRIKLISEEFAELVTAMLSNNRVKVADALGDLLYVIYGTGDTYGIDMDRVFERVHISNMSKLGADGKPIYNEIGKIVKGPNYAPPVLEDCV